GILHQRQIWSDMKFRHLAALHHHCAHPRNPVKRRLQLVGGQLPQLGLGHGIRRETVTEDRKGSECEPVGGYAGGGGKLLLHLRQLLVNQQQSLDHVCVPGKEQIDFRRSAAGDGAHRDQTGHGVHRFLDGPRDGDLHLLDGRDSVIDADDDARKVRLWKDGDGNLEREVNAGNGECDGKEDDRPRGAGQPEWLLRASALANRVALFGAHQSAPPPLSASPAGAGTTCTLVPGSSAYAPTVITLSAAVSPLVTCSSSLFPMPRVTGFF